MPQSVNHLSSRSRSAARQRSSGAAPASQVVKQGGVAGWPYPGQGVAMLGLGGLLGLSLAPISAWGLAWVALAPLWVVVLQTRLLRGSAILGCCWGLGYHGVALLWILRLHPLTWLGFPWWLSFVIATLAWGIATLWGASLPLLWAMGLKWFSRSLPNANGLPLVVLGAMLWGVLEWLWGRSPLWWTALANSQSPQNIALLQLSQFSGADSIALVLLFVNGMLALAWQQRQIKPLVLAVLLFALCQGLGWGLLQRPLATDPTTPLRIGLIQGNIPTRLKMSPAGLQPSVDTYLQGYRTLVSGGAEAVLLPEGALPFLWGRSGREAETQITQTVRTAQVPLWAGVFVPAGERYTQSLLNILSDGSVGGQYNKVKLVPLGETLPFGAFLERVLHHLSPIQLGMLPGSFHQTFDTPLGQAIVGICYDSVFPELFRVQAAAGGQFILSLANNDPFGRQMMAQHHALDTLRAIETDRWLVRATNTGLSVVINPRGRTLWKSSPDQSVTHLAAIERRTTQTFYVRFGNWFLPLMLLGSVVLWGDVLRKQW
jgi:apolipoprotein N-acyltransferase